MTLQIIPSTKVKDRSVVMNNNAVLGWIEKAKEGYVYGFKGERSWYRLSTYQRCVKQFIDRIEQEKARENRGVLERMRKMQKKAMEERKKEAPFRFDIFYEKVDEEMEGQTSYRVYCGRNLISKFVLREKCVAFTTQWTSPPQWISGERSFEDAKQDMMERFTDYINEFHFQNK